MAAQQSQNTQDPFNGYDSIDESELDQLKELHGWIVNPIYNASENIKKTPFFEWVNNLKSPKAFKKVALPLYYHSATFPKVMGLMLGLTPMRENAMMPFYAKHANGEADHHQLLLSWMLEHSVIQSASEIDSFAPNTETNACVNYAYQMAIEQNRDKWLVGLNSGIERCSNDFFKALSPKFHELGIGHTYFDIHVEADEHHSIMGLKYIEARDPGSAEGKALINKALEGIELWGRMINSWIGVDMNCKFDLDGSMLPVNHRSLV